MFLDVSVCDGEWPRRHIRHEVALESTAFVESTVHDHPPATVDQFLLRGPLRPSPSAKATPFDADLELS